MTLFSLVQYVKASFSYVNGEASEGIGSSTSNRSQVVVIKGVGRFIFGNHLRSIRDWGSVSVEQGVDGRDEPEGNQC